MRRLCVHLLCVVFLLFAAAAATAQDKKTPPAASDKAQIEALNARYLKAFNAKDTGGIMANYAHDQLFVFDVVPPRQYPSWDAYKKDFEGLFANFPGPVSNVMSDLQITVVGPVAYSHRIEDARFTARDGSTVELVVRVTDVYRKIKGKWLVVEEHVSVPVDPVSGKADLLSKP